MPSPCGRRNAGSNSAGGSHSYIVGSRRRYLKNPPVRSSSAYSSGASASYLAKNHSGRSGRRVSTIFNLWTTKKRVEKLPYMHRNPVRRGLAEAPQQWRWSSYRLSFERIRAGRRQGRLGEDFVSSVGVFVDSLLAASYPPLQTAQGRGTHPWGGVGQLKARAARPS